MAAVATVTESTVFGNMRVSFGTLAFDSSYPTGGEAITVAALSNNQITSYLKTLLVSFEPTAGYVFEYDYANEKVKAYRSGAVSAHTHTSAPHTHDLLLKDAAVADGATTRVNAGANLLGANTGGDLTVTGGGANGGIVSTTPGATGSNGAVSAAALAEVANTTDLSALTAVRYWIVGK